MDIPFNLWGVVAGAVVGMVVGTVWYGPLFGKKYMKAMGFDALSPEQRERMRKAMIPSYLKQAAASLVTFYVLSGLITWGAQSGATHGMGVAFWAWLGFILPREYGKTIWGGSKALFWMAVGGELVTFLIAGAVIGAMN